MNETTVPTGTAPSADCVPATATTTAMSSIPAPSAAAWKVTIVRCPCPARARWRRLSSSKRRRWRSSWANVRTVRMPMTVSSSTAICCVVASRAPRRGSRARRWSSAPSTARMGTIASTTSASSASMTNSTMKVPAMVSVLEIRSAMPPTTSALSAARSLVRREIRVPVRVRSKNRMGKRSRWAKTRSRRSRRRNWPTSPMSRVWA